MRGSHLFILFFFLKGLISEKLFFAHLINLSIVESKHVTGGKTITYGNAKYGIDKYGGKTPSIITYDERVNVGDVINAETEYLGIVSGRLIKQTFNLNSNVIIKEAVLR